MNRTALIIGAVVAGLLAALAIFRLSSVKVAPTPPSPPVALAPAPPSPPPGPREEQPVVLDGIPHSVFGGGTKVEVVVESTEAALLWLSFVKNPLGPDKPVELQAGQNVTSGVNTFTINLPDGLAGTAEVGREGLPKGARLKIRVKAPGAPELADAITVDEGTDGGVYFAQVNLADWAKGRPAEELPFGEPVPKKAP